MSTTLPNSKTLANSTAAPALLGLYADIQPELARVEERLQRELRSPHPVVDEVVRHGFRLGGKRLRPALVLLAAKTTGKLTEDHILLATIVEMIHTATLVHDDVLDEADLRRHEQTVNARWGNERSVLLGDFLFSHAFYLASTLPTTAACQVIGRSTNRVCDGELRQTLYGGNLKLTEQEYYEIIDAKTAELCACCCDLGSRYAGADKATVLRFENFGRHLGVAFQIIDDLLDLLGEEKETGKSVGADLAKRKLTLPLIHCRDSLVNGPKLVLLDMLAGGDRAQRGEIRRHLEATGSIAFARRAAEERVEQACTELAPLPDSAAKDTLITMAKFCVARTF